MVGRTVRVITRFELRRVLGSAPGAIFLVFFASFYVWLGVKITGWGDALQVLHDARQLGVAEGNPVYEFMAWVTNLEARELWNMFGSHPPILIVLFAITLFMLPALALMATADQAASDIGNRHMRYLLVRADRTSIYVGKTLGAFLFFAVSLFVAVIGMGLVVLLAGLSPDSSGAEIFMYLIRIYATCLAFSLPFIFLSGWAGAMTGNSFLGLLVTFGIYGFVAFVSNLMGAFNENLRYFKYIWPTAFKFHLMSDNMGDVGLALAHQLGIGVVIFWFGLVIFKRRNL